MTLFLTRRVSALEALTAAYTSTQTVVYTNSASWQNSFTILSSNSASWLLTDQINASIGSFITSITAVSASILNLSLLVSSISADITDTPFDNFNSNYNTLTGFITYELGSVNIHMGDTVYLKNGKIFMFATGNGASVNDYININDNVADVIYAKNLSAGDVLDAFALSSIGAIKYEIEVKDLSTNDLYFSSLIVHPSNTAVDLIEYSIVYTSTPFISYDAVISSAAVILKASTTQNVLSTKEFKGIRLKHYV